MFILEQQILFFYFNAELQYKSSPSVYL